MTKNWRKDCTGYSGSRGIVLPSRNVLGGWCECGHHLHESTDAAASVRKGD